MNHRSQAKADPGNPEDAYFTNDELARLDTAAWRRLDAEERTAMVRTLFRSSTPSTPTGAPLSLASEGDRGAESFTTCSGSSPPTSSRNNLHPLARPAERTTGTTTDPAAEVQPFACSADFEPRATEHGPERAPLLASSIGGRS